MIAGKQKERARFGSAHCYSYQGDQPPVGRRFSNVRLKMSSLSCELVLVSRLAFCCWLRDLARSCACTQAICMAVSSGSEEASGSVSKDSSALLRPLPRRGLE